MSELAAKNGWTRVAFGDVVQLSRKRSSDPKKDGFERYVGLEHIEPSDLKIRRWGDVADGTTFTNVFQAGQVLFGKRRAYQRKVAVADFDGVCSGDIYVLEPKDAHLLPELLPFICQTDGFFEHAVGTSAGSLSPRTNWNSLASYEFALPPMDEQRRIAHALQAAHQLLLTTAGFHNAAKRLLSSLQKRYFIEEPDGCVMEINRFADVRNGTTPRRNREDYWGGHVPWLPTGKVNERRITSADEFITDKALDECSLSIIPRGATLVAMIGEGQTRGRAAFLDIDACINQNFAAVIPDASVDPMFLFFLLESQYEALRHWSQGTNQHALNCRLIGSFRIRIPNLEKQRHILALLKDADSALEVAAARVSHARSLFQKMTGLTLGAEAS
jgi:type I restriction enzyme S subunit